MQSRIHSLPIHPRHGCTQGCGQARAPAKSQMARSMTDLGMTHAAILVSALLLSDLGSAQQPVPSEQLKQAIATCIAVVRGLPEEYRNQYRTFYAYVTAKGTVDRWATLEGDFQFQKCLAAQGISIN
jgi:hypothetical protein